MASSKSPRVPLSQKMLRPPSSAQVQVREIYILVMGLTGAGKSTFISVVTGDDKIPIGKSDDMDSVTDRVADYILNVREKGIMYEVHLIDSPGFDDGTMADVKVLTHIANFVNTHYKLGNTFAGVLYLHDITKGKMGGVGQRNLRMLEQMVGPAKWDGCTLVTTKWGCTTDLAGEEARERKLMDSDHLFGSMLKSNHQASIMRFDPRSKGRALEIIKPHLKMKFDPLISQEMVDPKGPMLRLGETAAGKIVGDSLEELEKVHGDLDQLKESRQLLTQKFDTLLFEKYKAARDKLMREHRLHKTGRWAVRTAIVGGAIAATVVTFGPGASAFALAPAYETYAQKQRSDDEKKMDDLKQDYRKESEAHISDGGGYDSEWLRDRKVRSMSDLSDNYSLRNRSSTDLGNMETLTEVATDAASFAIKDDGFV